MLRIFVLYFLVSISVSYASKASSVFGNKEQNVEKREGSPASKVFGKKYKSSSVANEGDVTDEGNVTEQKSKSVFGSKRPSRLNKEEKEISSNVTQNPRKTPEFLWPVDGGHITSFYGWRSSKRFHDGIDISAISGAKVFAAKSGQVIYSAQRIRGYGNMIVIRHNNGFHTVYANNKVNYVKKGSIVSQGDVIALLGNTGHSSGPHVHFEIRQVKYSKDPLKYLGNVPASKGAYRNVDGEALFSK